MNIKDQIRKELERRMDKHWDLLPNADSPEDDWTHNELCELGAFKELEYLETFLDSIPEQEWDEKDEKMRDRIIDILNRTFSVYSALGTSSTRPSCPTYKDEINWLKSLRPQPKQEWSEEDIKKIRSEEYTKGFNDAAFGGKLKEWSVEDEDRIRQIERIAQQAGCTQKLQEEIHDWLKSLRPQWHPSEEQIYSLGTVVKGAGENSVGSVAYNLKELYEELKKL